MPTANTTSRTARSSMPRSQRTCREASAVVETVTAPPSRHSPSPRAGAGARARPLGARAQHDNDDHTRRRDVRRHRRVALFRSSLVVAARRECASPSPSSRGLSLVARASPCVAVARRASRLQRLLVEAVDVRRLEHGRERRHEQARRDRERQLLAEPRQRARRLAQREAARELGARELEPVDVEHARRELRTRHEDGVCAMRTRRGPGRRLTRRRRRRRRRRRQR